jgi:hypothetical protein
MALVLFKVIQPTICTARGPRSLMSSGRNPGASEANSKLICALHACNHPCAGAFACKDITFVVAAAPLRAAAL